MTNQPKNIAGTAYPQQQFWLWQTILWCVVLAIASEARGQGVIIPSVGAINQSMGGATVAAPIDSIGSLAWNPAAISALPQNEVAFGLGLVLPTTSLSSAIPAFGLAG